MAVNAALFSHFLCLLLHSEQKAVVMSLQRRGTKTIEIWLGESVPVPFTHILLQSCAAWACAKTLIGKLADSLGPFCTPKAAWNNVGWRCLGMDFDQLKALMTIKRKDRFGVRRPRVIPVMLHFLQDGQETNVLDSIDGPGNQPDFRHHEYLPKDGVVGDLVCLL